MIEDFVIELGLSPDDLIQIKEAKSKDELTPFISSFKDLQRSIVLQDPTIEETYSTKYGGMVIGKEKQLKKEFAKLSGLTLTTEEIEKSKFADLVTLANSVNTKQPDDSEITELKAKYNNLVDELDKVKLDKENSLKDLESKYENERRDAFIINALETYIPSILPKLPVSGVKTFVKAYKGILASEGVVIASNDKNNLELQKDGVRFVKDGKVVHLSEDIKAFYENMTGATFERKPEERTKFENNPKAESVAQKNRAALEMMGL